MPKVNFYHFTKRTMTRTAEQCPFEWHEGNLTELGNHVLPLVAEACDIPSMRITADKVDWVPVRYLPGTIVTHPIGFEIETFNFQERLDKMTQATGKKLKVALLDHKLLSWYPPDEPLIWLKYQLRKGWHL